MANLSGKTSMIRSHLFFNKMPLFLTFLFLAYTKKYKAENITIHLIFCVFELKFIIIALFENSWNT